MLTVALTGIGRSQRAKYLVEWTLQLQDADGDNGVGGDDLTSGREDHLDIGRGNCDVR